MDCAVCGESIGLNDVTCTLRECAHTFHAECVQRWIATVGSASTCPLCRSSNVECQHSPRAREHNSATLLGELVRTNSRDVRSLGERLSRLEGPGEGERGWVDSYTSVQSETEIANEQLFTVAYQPFSDSD